MPVLAFAVGAVLGALVIPFYPFIGASPLARSCGCIGFLIFGPILYVLVVGLELIVFALYLGLGPVAVAIYYLIYFLLIFFLLF